MSRSRSVSRSVSPECPRGQDPKQWKSLFIGYLPNHAKMDDVEDFFKGYGEIVSISLKPGYGFVTMKHRRDAERVVRELDGERMAGERVDIQHAKTDKDKGKNVRGSLSPIRGRPTRRQLPNYCIIVQNLTTRCSWQDLKDFIRKETKVETAFCQAHRDKVGEGVVAFNRVYDRDQVLRECDGLMINGKRIKMQSAMRRSRSRSRSR